VGQKAAYSCAVLLTILIAAFLLWWNDRRHMPRQIPRKQMARDFIHAAPKDPMPTLGGNPETWQMQEPTLQ
jgi:hypothetical protein